MIDQVRQAHIQKYSELRIKVIYKIAVLKVVQV